MKQETIYIYIHIHIYIYKLLFGEMAVIILLGNIVERDSQTITLTC